MMGVFKQKNENYDKAMLGIKNFKKTFDGFVIAYPDITSDEIMFIKNHWETLPKKIASGVKLMALNFVNGTKTALISYKPNGYVKSHAHHLEYEIGEVIKGSLFDLLTGKIYNVGDTYYFSPNEKHSLQSFNNGSLIHSTLTTNPSYRHEKLNLALINSLKSA